MEIYYDILIQLGYEGYTYLAQGSRAKVFLNKKSRRVVKLTTDALDFVVARKLVGKKPKMFARVFKAEKVHLTQGRDKKDIYLIESAYVGESFRDSYGYSGFTNMVDDMFDYIESFYLANSKNKTMFFIDDIFSYLFCDFIDNVSIIEGGKEYKNKFINILHEYKKLVKETRKLGIPNFDYHLSNFSYKGGKIKVFDYGFSGSANQHVSLEEVEKIKYYTSLNVNIKL